MELIYFSIFTIVLRVSLVATLIYFVKITLCCTGFLAVGQIKLRICGNVGSGR